MPAIPDGFGHLSLSTLTVFVANLVQCVNGLRSMFIYGKAEFICTYTTSTAAHSNASYVHSNI